MPRRSHSASNQPVSAQRKQEQSGDLHLLLVDREPSMGRMLSACLKGQRVHVFQVASSAEARTMVAARRVDLAVVDPNLPDGSGLNLAREIAARRPAIQTLLLTDKPSVEAAIEAIRLGAADLIVKPVNQHDLTLRLRNAIGRLEDDRRGRLRVRRLRRVCKKLIQARREITQQVDILCNDLVTAYHDLATQMNQVAQASEFTATLRQELDLESLIRKTLEHLLEKAGPTNAAVFLPTGSDEFALGGYVNYDCASGSSDIVLTHLADVLAPLVSREEGIIHVTDDKTLAHWLGDDSAYLADSDLLAVSARAKDETLAVIALFRDRSQPFSQDFIDGLAAIAHPLAEYLARIIRVHHRAL